MSTASPAPVIDRNDPAVKALVVETIKEMGLVSRVEQVENETKLRKDPFYAEKLNRKLSREFVEPFFSLAKDARRPSTEYYWISGVMEGGFRINLTSTDSVHNEVSKINEPRPAVKLTFMPPPHLIGTDLSDKTGDITGKYWIMWADVALLPEVTIRAEDMRDKSIRLPAQITEPREGILPLRQAMAVMDTIMRSKTGPAAHYWNYNGESFKKLMTGEQFRVWALAKYRQRWDAEDGRARVADVTRDFMTSADKTGEALESLLAGIGGAK